MRLIHVVNPFIRNPDHILKNITWRLNPSISYQPHVFIIGAPRSGTTLLESILDVHPNIGSIKVELGFFTIRDIYSFKAIYFSGVDSNFINKIFTNSDDIVQYYDYLSQYFLSVKGGTRFLEKTPQNIFKLKFLRRHFPKAKFIHIYRDGRDCYCSSQGNRNVVQGKTIQQYAQYWKRCIHARQACGETTQILDVKYEELTTHPEATVRQIMQFLGEAYSPDQLNPACYSNHPSSRRREFDRLSKPISSSSNGRWMRELTQQEIQIFHRIADRQLLSLGYSLENRVRRPACPLK